MSKAFTRENEINRVPPIARALLKARVGDEVQLMTPGGLEQVEVLAMRYPAPAAQLPRFSMSTP